ncbi:hypothetical protein LCGC14_2269530 [marine sediment metagenome]|uniref:O-antigen ligase domain-containing protein n=1 Tax=marine sediment metagenome TaxID=412755 RepID=A0A0F9CXN3_9ZZZZ
MFRGMRKFWLFGIVGFFLALQVGKVNWSLGLLLAWMLVVGHYDVMSGRWPYAIGLEGIVWIASFAALFLLGFWAKSWRCVAVVLAVIVVINLDIASRQVAGIERVFPVIDVNYPIVGFMENQPNLAHLIAISLPLMGGIFAYLAAFGLVLIPLKSTVAYVAGAVGLSLWKPTVMIPLVLIAAVGMMITDPPMLPSYSEPLAISPPRPKGAYFGWNMGDMQRPLVWKEAITMTAKGDGLQIGHGVGSFKRQFVRMALSKNITPGEYWFHPQNELVHLFYETGLLGVVFAVMAAVLTLIRAYRHKINSALIGAFAAVLISSLGYEAMTMPHLMAVGAMIWGLNEAAIWEKVNG